MHRTTARRDNLITRLAGAALAALVIVSVVTQAAHAAELSSSTAAATLEDLQPTANRKQRERALTAIAAARDVRFLAPLLDLERFADAGSEYERQESLIEQTLETFTGGQIKTDRGLSALGTVLDPLSGSAFARQSAWDTFVAASEWYGRHEDLPAPPGYQQWKGRFYAQMVDPKMARFFAAKPPTGARLGEVVWGGVKVDGIPALVNPHMIRANDAHYLGADDPVFGVSINGDSRAYPLRIMDWHEMADDIVGGQPVALSYCTLCASAILYDSNFGGRALVFGSSGFLYGSNKLMYDHQTFTLWNQLTGKPVIGPLAGQGRLRILPLVTTSWAQWTREHPETLVIDPNTGYQRPYALGASYGAYFGSPELMFPAWRRSGTLPPKALVYGVEADGRQKAYPLDGLNRSSGVIDDTVGSENLVVVYLNAAGQVELPASWLAALKARGGKEATLTLANDLPTRTAEDLMFANPALADSLTAPILLAMPTDTRLSILRDFTWGAPKGVSEPGSISTQLRNEVAERAMDGETRTYQRGTHRFERAASQELLDERGVRWRVTEAALISDRAERLERIPGHLSYWFAWYEFFPTTTVYGPVQADRAH